MNKVERKIYKDENYDGTIKTRKYKKFKALYDETFEEKGALTSDKDKGMLFGKFLKVIPVNGSNRRTLFCYSSALWHGKLYVYGDCPCNCEGNVNKHLSDFAIAYCNYCKTFNKIDLVNKKCFNCSEKFKLNQKLKVFFNIANFAYNMLTGFLWVILYIAKTIYHLFLAYCHPKGIKKYYKEKYERKKRIEEFEYEKGINRRWVPVINHQYYTTEFYDNKNYHEEFRDAIGGFYVKTFPPYYGSSWRQSPLAYLRHFFGTGIGFVISVIIFIIMFIITGYINDHLFGDLRIIR